jgi:hypothetical protein
MSRKRGTNETDEARRKRKALLRRLPDSTRSRLEALMILQVTGIQFKEFSKNLQLWIMRQTLEDIETRMVKLEKNIKDYENAIKRRSFASRLAKLEGGDSFFELKVKKLLERLHIQFKYNEVLRLGIHRYRSDFLIGSKTIIETAGVPTEYYWKHHNVKVKDYIAHGYVVCVIVLDKLFEKAMNYLPNSAEVRIIKYNDFKYRANECLRSLATDDARS